MFTITHRAVTACVLACGAWALMCPPVALADEENPLSPATIVAKKFEGKATVEFSVGQISLLPTSWTDEGWKAASLRIAPKGEKQYEVSVIVSRQTLTRLKQLGIENPAEHFRGKVLRVSGHVERLPGSFGSEYCIQVRSLDQLEAIRRYNVW